MNPPLLPMDWVPFLHATEPWLILFATAAMLLLVTAFTRERPALLLSLISLVGVGAAFVETWRLWLAGGRLTSGMLLFDRLSFVGWMLCLLAGALTLLMSSRYLAQRKEFHPEYFILILLALIGQGCLIAAADLVTFFLGLETMSVAVYALAGFFRRRPEGNEAALKYFLIGAFASAFLVMGIAFLFGATGTTDLSLLASRAGEALTGDGKTFFLFGMACVVIGVGFKIAAVPFHAWAPDVYDGAPTPITAFMATAVKAAAFFAFVRIAAMVFQQVGESWEMLIWGLAVATMVVGNIAAIAQDNVKRMLAYSSIAHAGYALVAFPMLGQSQATAQSAVMLYLFAYVVMTLGAFAIVTACQGSTESADIQKFSGLGRRHPWLAALFALFLLSLAGFPPTIGFFAKYYLFLGAMREGFVWLVVIALLNSALSAYYYLRPLVVMYFREPVEGATTTPATSLPIVAVVTLTALAVFLFGLFPGSLLAIVEHSIF